MDRRLGYDFTVRLTETIAAAVALAGPGAFAYRGADLSHAVERQVYTKLVNDEELYAAFDRAHGAARPATTSLLDRHVVDLVLAESRRSPRAIVATAHLLSWRRRRPPPPAPEAPRWPGGPVVYLLDHPKFLWFIAPLLEADGSGDAVLLSSVGELPVEHWQLDYGEREHARTTPGPGLRERDRLAIAFDILTEALAEARPRCLVLIEGNSAFDEVANRAARGLGVPTVCLQQGWSPIVHSGFRNMSFTRMAVWGEGFRRLLVPHNPAQRFDVTGNPSFARDPAMSPVKRRAIVFFLQTTSPVISEAHLSDLGALIVRTRERLPGVPVLVREHPAHPLLTAHRERLGQLPDVAFVPAETHSLRSVIEQSRVAVSIYSTTLLESAALDTPPVVFNPTSMPRSSPDLEAAGAGLETRNPEDALAAIERIVTDDAYHASFADGMARVRQEFFAGADGRAAERILAVIRSCSQAAQQ